MKRDTGIKQILRPPYTPHLQLYACRSEEFEANEGFYLWLEALSHSIRCPPIVLDQCTIVSMRGHDGAINA